MSRLICLSVFLAGSGIALAESPALTIYNQNFGVVRETVTLDLQQGENLLDFSEVTANLEPDSVILRDPTGRAQLRILEQNYRNDPASVGLLLQFYEGKQIDFLAPTEDDPDRIVTGTIIRSGYGSGDPIIQVDGQIRFGLPGQPLFPKLSDDSILKPTLSWLLRSNTAGKVPLELSYVTSGLTWSADYNLVAPEKGDTVDLIGWITMQNHTGRTFENAKFKLVAGDVSKIVQKERFTRALAGRMALPEMAKDEAAVSEKSFDDFHMYTVARQTTLRDRQSQQVEFIRAENVKAPRVYIYDGGRPAYGAYPYWMSGALQIQQEIGNTGNKKVWIVREIKNEAANALGMPLPAGRVRFYRADDDGLLEFTGENEIDHTAKDETLKLYTGNAFDLVGERTQVNYDYSQRDKWIREEYKIELRNRKETPVTIRVVEHLFRWTRWEISEYSHPFNKKDSRTIEFDVEVPANGEAEVSYTVRYDWR